MTRKTKVWPRLQMSCARKSQQYQKYYLVVEVVGMHVVTFK